MNEDSPIEALQVYEYSLNIYYTLEKMQNEISEIKRSLRDIKRYNTTEDMLKTLTNALISDKIAVLKDYIEDLYSDNYALKEVNCERL